MVKPRVTHFLDSKIFTAICIVLILVFGFGLANSIAKNNSLKKDVTTLTNRAQELDRLTEQMKSNQDLNASADNVERDARLRLGLQKPGESVIIIRGGNAPVPSKNVSNDDSGVSKPSNLKRWFKYFIN